jgi:hypothetical protein
MEFFDYLCGKKTGKKREGKRKNVREYCLKEKVNFGNNYLYEEFLEGR